jgi:transcriptional regulator with XRE-family HTH domain
MDFSLIFKDLRRAKKLTQIDFAKKLAVSRSTIAQIETSINKPSRETILRILEIFDVPDNLRRQLEEYADGNVSLHVEGKDVTDVNDRIPDYSKETVWETYGRLATNKKIILCLGILLKETQSYEFTADEKSRLLRIDTAISYMESLAFGRIQFRERLFNKVNADLKASDEFIDEFSNLVLPNYKNRIRDFKDLFYSNTYENEDDSYMDDDVKSPI